jgi:lipopolysaccharide biosynthesis glycosyltransferase
MNHSLDENEIDYFEKYLTKRCKMQLIMVDVKRTALDNYPLAQNHLKIEMYYRILAQFLLPVKLDRILWLDADIVVMKDISSFYNQEFDGNVLVACPDCNNGTSAIKNCLNRMCLPDDHLYFNSGVLLMNLKKLRENTTMECVLQQCEEFKERLTYPDQDILNKLYANQVKYAPWKQYNYQVGMIKRIPKEDVKQIAILHYTSYVKPWRYWDIANCSRYYWKVRFKQGHYGATCKAYLRKIWDVLAPAFREVRDILF